MNCKRLAENMFQRSQQTISRCIGALDGMCVRINKPRESDVDNPLHFLNRKGFFSINLQAICDADRKFIWYSMDTAGGTHDSLAFKLSDLGMKLDENGIKEGYWIAGDDAYACSEWLLCPYSKQSCRGYQERDDFNFYQSRCRINIECAFGMLVHRFGVLRRPMRCKLSEVTVVVVVVCMKLHNLCIDDNEHVSHPRVVDIDSRDIMTPISNANLAYAPRNYKKRQKSTTRQAVCEDLKRIGLVRPIRVHNKRARVG